MSTKQYLSFSSVKFVTTCMTSPVAGTQQSTPDQIPWYRKGIVGEPDKHLRFLKFSRFNNKPSTCIRSTEGQ